MNNQKIGEFIKELRKEKNLTQKELADKLNITDRAVSKWERGLNCPDISLLDDLSQILEVSVIEILKGRKLDKDELVNNKELVETMSFASSNLKQKIKKSLDLISIAITGFIALLLLFYNIKGFYYSHKTYKVNMDNSSEYQQEYTEKYINKLSNYINLIESNQGIYTDEEYKLIRELVSDIKVLYNKSIEQELLSKTKLTIKDFNSFFDKFSIYDITGYDGFLHYKDIYKIILKYDIDRYDNMLSYNYAQRINLNTYTELSNIYYPIYRYGYTLDQYTPYENYINVIINLKYTSYNLILKDIIEVGGINA